MDRDLLAAAAAAGADIPCDVEMCTSTLGRRTGGGSNVPASTAVDGYVPYDDPGVFELPSVDDMEVAAAAAAAALEVLAPAPYGRQQGGDSSSDDGDDSSSDDSNDESDSGDDDDDDSSEEERDGQVGSAGSLSVRLVVEGETVAVVLHVLPSAAMERYGPSPGADDVAMREAETDSSPLSSSSSSSDDEGAAVASSCMVDDGELEALDHDGLRALITKAYAVADGEDGEDEEGGGGGGAGGRASALKDLGLPLAAPELAAGVEVTAEDALEPAGTCLSVLEGMVVMQGLANSRPLADGSLVVAEDRTPLGMVEEVFGQVAQPLYAFRHVVKGPMPACVKPGAALFVVPRLSRHLTADEIYGPGGARPPEPEPASDDEVYFSDDETEQHYMRQQVAKRKGGPEGVGGTADAPHGVAAAEGGAGTSNRPRQRTRAATKGSVPGTQFQVNATAGAMTALLGLGGGDERSGGGRGGGGRGRGVGGRGDRVAGGPGGRQSQQQGGRGAGGPSGSHSSMSGNGGSGGGGGNWMRPLRDSAPAPSNGGGYGPTNPRDAPMHQQPQYGLPRTGPPPPGQYGGAPPPHHAPYGAPPGPGAQLYHQPYGAPPPYSTAYGQQQAPQYPPPHAGGPPPPLHHHHHSHHPPPGPGTGYGAAPPGSPVVSVGYYQQQQPPQQGPGGGYYQQQQPPGSGGYYQQQQPQAPGGIHPPGHYQQRPPAPHQHFSGQPPPGQQRY